MRVDILCTIGLGALLGAIGGPAIAAEPATPVARPAAAAATAAEQRGIIIVGGSTATPNPAGQAVARPPTTVIAPAASTRAGADSPVQAPAQAVPARQQGAAVREAREPRTAPAIVESSSARSATTNRAAANASGAIQGTARNAADDLVVGRLSGVRAITGAGEVGFQFTARPNAAPYILLSTSAPTMGSDGLLVLRDGLRMRADRDNRYSNERVTRYIGASRPQGLSLAHGTTYHYLVTVPGGGSARTQQASGTFALPPRTVVVKFDRFRLLDRADLGKFDLVLELNPREAVTNQAAWRQTDWNAGELQRLDREIVLSGDVRHLRLMVTGRSHGSDGALECFGAARSLPQEPDAYFKGDHRYADGCTDVNIVKAEYSLDTGALSIPGRSVPFTLRAMAGPAPRGRVRTSFEISGSVSVLPP